ncbi:hypothetical protein LTR53_011221 [Teratosphaeriaceae sp. CCFEE 6253]|nr:hypothetical protein LTR53_011221 [Teratosphaeriaceae sp. CCFEE 6253]
MSPTNTQPTFIDLGAACTPMPGMPGYSECTSAYVTSAAASTATAVVRRAAHSITAGDLNTVCGGHKMYVNMAIYGGAGFLAGIFVFLIALLCVRRHKKMKGGKK